MKYSKWLLVLGWFAVLLVFNIASRWSQNADKNGLFIFLEAVGYLTSAWELVLSAVVVSLAVFSKRKPMAER
jgi:hypothetical protein